MRSSSSSRPFGSSPAAGSSMTMTSGFMASTPAKATRRCCPPESSKGLASRTLAGSSPAQASARSTRASISSAPTPRFRGPKATSSATVAANSWCSGYWNTTPMRPRTLACAFLSARLTPQATMRPAVGCRMPFMCWTSVLFPLPVCPAMPRNSPSCTVRFTSSRTSLPPAPS